MPPVERRDFRQKVVWWKRTGQDVYAEPTVEGPFEIKCRWVTTLTEGGNPAQYGVAWDAQISTGAAVKVGDLLWLGGLDDLPGTGLVPETDIFEAKRGATTPDVKNRNTRYEFGLMRFKDSLPSFTQE
ncbi:MAG: hypothetical protein ACRC7O_04490 [Fimbriiglobus sp.]